MVITLASAFIAIRAGHGNSPPPAAVASENWPDRTAASASRDGFARWPVPSPASRAKASAASRGSGAKQEFSICGGGNAGADRHGGDRSDPSVSPPLSVRLRRQFCATAADLDRKMQLWRRDSVPDAHRRRI